MVCNLSILDRQGEKNQDLKNTNENAFRLEFSQSTIVEYAGHNKTATGIVYNPNAK